MVGKQGFMKTMEILLVIVLTTIFVLTVVPSTIENDREEQKFYLNLLESDIEFRDFLINNNNCFNSTQDLVAINKLKVYLPLEQDFKLCVDKIPEDLPPRDVTVDTLFFVGNYTDVDYKIIRLYYSNNN